MSDAQQPGEPGAQPPANDTVPPPAPVPPAPAPPAPPAPSPWGAPAAPGSETPAPPPPEPAPTVVIPTPAPAYAPPPTWPPHNAAAPQGQPPQGPGAPGAYPQSGAPVGAYPPPGYPPAYGYAYPPAPKTSSTAIIGLVLSIISWFICPIVPAVIALILAHTSGKEIASSQGRVGGAGLNTATRIISWINIAFYGLITLGVLVFALIAAIAGSVPSN